MAYLNSRPQTPEVCPVCGEDVPPRALACPECGADHNSGWKPDADSYDGAGLPDEDFDYNEFVENEFGTPTRAPGFKLIWWVTAAIILAAMIALAVFSIIPF